MESRLLQDGSLNTNAREAGMKGYRVDNKGNLNAAVVETEFLISLLPDGHPWKEV